MRPFRVLMVLPPDVHAPEVQRHHRFPPQGPAVVAACVAPEGFALRVADLELSAYRRPLATPLTDLDWSERVDAALHDRPTPSLDALADELAGRLDALGDPPDAYAFSLDRHTQVGVTALLARRLKRRTGRPLIVGGAGASACRELFERTGARGVDVVTNASTPREIRAAFRTLRSTARGRMEAPVEPGVLVSLGRRETPDAGDWPTPDFGVYDLDDYRRDPVAADPRRFHRYDGSLGAGLVLPYSFTYECQFSCAFCQTDGRQSHKDLAQAARELATLAERHDVRGFALFDAQINLVARGFAKALLDARAGVRWSDSYRVRPSSPEDLDLMRESGCVALTVGVESASDAVLKKMVKGHQRRHADELLAWCAEREIMTRVNLLPCFPGETREDFEATRAWVRERAAAIDDLAPSSFYLTADSPVGRDPARFGIALRGDRRLDGEYRFRKQYDSLAYDEAGGMTWEEREPTLRQAERALLDAWAEGAPDLARVRGLRPGQMLALRGRYPTRAAAYEALTAWAGDGGAPRDDAPAAHAPARPRVTFPEPCAPALAGRFERAIEDADESLRRFMGARPAGLMFLFGGGDYLIVRGSLEREGTSPSRVRIRDIVARRMADTGRRRLYGRLAPGAAFDVRAASLVAEGAAWEEPVAYGEDFVVLEFAAP